MDRWVESMENAVLQRTKADNEDEETGWGPWVATMISKVRATTTNLLCGRKVVPYIVEWCETPIEKTSGFACKESCFVFNDDGPGLTRVKKCPDLNVYMYLPQCMHDAALSSHVDRLRRFFATTFYNNATGLKCHFAAFSLVLRGHNIDRAFWTIGAGGVGQSLLSHLVATVFGNHHAFLDMNMHYTDDELRKQGELLSGKAGRGTSGGISNF